MATQDLSRIMLAKRQEERTKFSEEEEEEEGGDGLRRSVRSEKRRRTPLKVVVCLSSTVILVLASVLAGATSGRSRDLKSWPHQDEEQSKEEAHVAPPSVPSPQALHGGQLVRTVNPGDRVNIPCSLANMGGSIQFAKDDQPIILDSGCAHCQLDISNDGQASLTINRVTAKDQGHWQCWRLDTAGKVKQKIPIIQLVVTNSPELPILVVNDKELLGGNNLDATISVRENEIVNFKCLIKGAASPVDYVHWIVDSSSNATDSSQLMMEYSPQENNYLTQSILKLNATKAMNLKSISCLSKHKLWLTPMTVTAFLNVLYEPSFTISREPGFGVPVVEGMTVILKCEIDSNPSSSPVWIKDADNKTMANANANALPTGQTVSGKEASGEPIVLDTQDDGSLVLQPVQWSDSGWYRCKTENKYGNFSSFGYYLNVRTDSPQPQAPPTLLGQPSLQPARFGHQLAPLQAPSRLMAPNQPAAQTANRVSALSQQHSSASNMINNDQPLPVLPFNPSMTPPSAIGADPPSQQRHKNLRAESLPEIEHPVSTVSAVLGRQLILPLRFCCSPGPARVFWIHRHLAMVPGRIFGPYITRELYTTYNSLNCYESTFEIESVKPEDIGTVYVFVSNEKGHNGAQIHIQLSKLDQSAPGSRFALPSSSASSSLPNKLEFEHLVRLLIASFLLLLLFERQIPVQPQLDDHNR